MSEKRRWPWPAGTSGRILVIAGAAVGAAVVLYVIAVLVAGPGIARGTSVRGVEIGGMSNEEAVAALDDAFATSESATILVHSARKEFPVKPAEAGLSLNAEATVEQAAARTLNPVALLTNFFTKRTLEPVVDIDQDSLDAQVDAIATVMDRPAVEPTVEMKGLQPVRVAGQAGRAIDPAAASAALVEAFAAGDTEVTINPSSTEPKVSDDALAQAQAQARQAVSAPVTVQAQTVTARLTKRAIARALGFTEQDGQLTPVLDGAVLHRALATQLAPIEVPGRDATFVIRDGAPVIVPSKVGSGVSDAELSGAVAGVIDLNPPDRTVTVSVGVREPALTTEQAQSLGVTSRLSTFTQNFPYAAYRKQNIGQAARRVNGAIVMPGETFSMNDTIKERTEANGYTVGFVIGQGGIFAQELGGGVSTATTATWTAAFYAGMEPEQVIAHSIYISRYKPGLEATVAWGIFDMKFKNPYSDAVYIQASATSTSITVSFWGTPVYSEIKAEFGPRRDIKPFKTIYDQSTTCLGQGGMEGFTIDVDRVFFKDGVEVKRQTITTKYKPSPEVICGKEKKPKPGTSFKPSPSASASPSPSATGRRPAATKSPSATPGAGDGAPSVTR
ncbi:MAG: VanW family protein [Candidatus Nanopelagicales bacterium]|nr:VanW family protein [Candidatus Nanopelagicales bacterium]